MIFRIVKDSASESESESESGNAHFARALSGDMVTDTASASRLVTPTRSTGGEVSPSLHAPLTLDSCQGEVVLSHWSD